MTRFSSKSLVVGLFVAAILIGCNKQSATEADAPALNQPPTTVLDANMAASVAFLEETSKLPGVTTTASGLQYEVLTAGEGEKPNVGSRVTVHYEGTLPNGDVFDSSYARGETIAFPLSGVIAGWTEGVQLMSPGAKYKFYIPSELAYGKRGAGAGIGPNQALIFTVELFSFE
ncbi:MAG: FKBP-type peptidyl-prolyl cis-trans isomerase [Thalassolituus oleivorans]|jgi:FKBP-type peptidyl-prolyl cis-trans isomerase